jgi:glyoxylase-like metal-dependent hydrolase (beta-lactamase superfamily II)
VRPRDVAPGVRLFAARTPTIPPASETNSYAVGRREIVLVEPATPYDDERRAWLEWARSIEGTIQGIFVTHHHVDHGSSTGFFARELKVPVLAHPITIERLRDLEGVELRPTFDDQVVTEGWTALHTPGHAPGHLCLHAEKTLIAGDMVANGSTILIPPDDGGDMAEYLRQLERLDALGSTLMLPAHGEPFDDPHAVFTYYLAHRRKREEKIFAAWQAKKSELGRAPTVEEIVPTAYDDTPAKLWPLAREAAQAHVIKLRNEGRI